MYSLSYFIQISMCIFRKEDKNRYSGKFFIVFHDTHFIFSRHLPDFFAHMFLIENEKIKLLAQSFLQKTVLCIR